MRIFVVLALLVGLTCWGCSEAPIKDCNGNGIPDVEECDQTAPYEDAYKCCKCNNSDATEYIPALGKAEWGIPENTPWECVIENEAWRDEVRCDVCRMATWKDFCRVE